MALRLENAAVAPLDEDLGGLRHRGLEMAGRDREAAVVVPAGRHPLRHGLERHARVAAQKLPDFGLDLAPRIDDAGPALHADRRASRPEEVQPRVPEYGLLHA